VSWAHEHLGIDLDADERAIKRAYAAKLRTTRPDEDPAGFQRLNEAYQQAKSWARHRLEVTYAEPGNDVDAFGTNVRKDEPDTEPADGREENARQDGHRLPHQSRRTGTDILEHTASPSFRAAASMNQEKEAEQAWLIRTCIEIASKESVTFLREWLSMQPVLWSFERKAEIGHELLLLLEDTLPPITRENFDVLADFFGYNDLQSSHDALEMSLLRTALHEEHRHRQATPLPAESLHYRFEGQPLSGFDRKYDFTPLQTWIADPPNASPYDANDTGNSWDPPPRLPPIEARREAFLAQAVTSHPHLLRRHAPIRGWLLAMIPGYASSAAKFLREWDAYLDGLPQEVDRNAIRFWQALADRSSVSASRFLLVLIRCCLLGVAVAAMQPVWMSLPELEDYQGTRVLTAVATATASLCGWAYLATIQWLVLRQFRPRTNHPTNRIDAFASPGLAACAGIVAGLTEADHVALAIAIAAIAVSIAGQLASSRKFPFPFGWVGFMLDSTKSFPVVTCVVGAPFFWLFAIMANTIPAFTAMFFCIIAAGIWVLGARDAATAS